MSARDLLDQISLVSANFGDGQSFPPYCKIGFAFWVESRPK